MHVLESGKHVEIKVLRHFIAVVQEEGVTAAAEVLRISQPALSRQIKDLEGEMGATLFVRGNRGRALELTHEGQLLYRRACEIVELADRTRSEIASGEQVEGDVHVAAAQTAVMDVLAKAAVHVRELHPGVRIQLHDDYGENIMERLNNGLADFGVLVQPADMSRYDHLPLPGGDRMGLIMRPDHPLAARSGVKPADLQGLPLIVPKGALARRDLSGWYSGSLRPFDIVGTMNLTYNASRFVRAGYSCALSLEGLVDTGEGSGLTFRPLEPTLRASLSMAWKKSQPLTPAARAFLDCVHEVVGGDVPV
ncbi:LysR family transcriptional regulator [Bifidobacterium sp.]|uniref:LysR family transcriptional regulator n=1 Tax=Bifidobacterium sp. TaxID=41200 RepID=UPI003D7E9508